MTRLALILSVLVLAACGRPLSETEHAFAARLMGPGLDASKVRLVQGAPVAAVTFRRKARPRVTCRERIMPPPKSEIVTAKPAAVTLFNRVFFARDWYTGNYLPRWPERMDLVSAMLIAHELTHVWQWQQRALTGYAPWRAAAEHGNSDDPYLFDLGAAPRFLDFGYEQQGAIVEEYVCCRALAPQAARTHRLHEMLVEHMPVAPLPPDAKRESDVLLPWREANLDEICA